MSEAELQKAVATYLATRYPDVLFHSDFGSGVKLTPGQARVQSAQNAGRRGWPDLFVAKPVGDHYGLFVELKKEGTRLFKLNGEYATPHIKEQAAVLAELRGAGYWACFAIGLDQAMQMIDGYMAGGFSSEIGRPPMA